MSPLNSLIIAEQIVNRLGDSNWFCQQYTMSREYYGIQDSLEMALEQQGLLETFYEAMKNV